MDALELALAALGRKERTTAELAAWLAERGCAQEEVDATVSRLVQSGQLDDERFAHRFAADKRELSGWGPERIREALGDRKLPVDLIDAAVGEEGRSGQVERARALLERRGDHLGDDAARSRALGFLTRRGYEYEVAYEAIRRAA